MNIKQSIIYSSAFILIFQSCSNNSSNQSNMNSQEGKTDNGKKYVMIVSREKYDSAAGKFKPDNITETVNATNDTTAYFTALKIFYNQKIVERQKSNYGQPKSFTITDKDGVDLKAKLSDQIKNGLKEQVENMPDVKNMIDEYRRDSL